MEYFLQALKSATGLIFSLDKEVYIVVWTSIKISVTATFLASVISIPMGFLVAFNDFIGRKLLIHILNTLMAIPTVVVGLLFYGILTRQGPLGDLSILYTPYAIILGECILIIPIIWNLSITAVSSADPRLMKTCDAMGANGTQKALLFINEVRYGLLAAIVVGFGRAIGEIGVAMMLGGNIEGFTRTITTAIALETSKGEFEFGLALGILLLVVAFIVNAILQRFQHLNR